MRNSRSFGVWNWKMTQIWILWMRWIVSSTSFWAAPITSCFYFHLVSVSSPSCWFWNGLLLFYLDVSLLKLFRRTASIIIKTCILWRVKFLDQMMIIFLILRIIRNTIEVDCAINVYNYVFFVASHIFRSFFCKRRWSLIKPASFIFSLWVLINCVIYAVVKLSLSSFMYISRCISIHNTFSNFSTIFNGFSLINYFSWNLSLRYMPVTLIRLVN